MLGGHLDSWTAGSGATDNAAGCAVAIEALRILRALDLTPRRTIRLALWDAEETSNDYAGSIGYVRRHYGNPDDSTRKPQHAAISAYFNFDNGSGRIRGINLQGAVRPVFRPCSRRSPTCSAAVSIHREHRSHVVGRSASAFRIAHYIPTCASLTPPIT
jgi:Zn-dependent M28 family amino/carboxypeptidase